MKNKAYKISLISLILAFSANMPSDARVNVNSGNRRSYADSYNQVANISYQQEYANAMTTTNVTTASDTGLLPVAVDDKKLAESILNNTASNVNISDLENCAMIYPSGLFKWAIPESGVRQTQTPQCVAVVELVDANTKAVLATTTLAAGDTMKCNIDMFPESGWLEALESVELPADTEPTLADVESVMNAEQKQNAGLKIAAGAIIAGVAGNLLAPKEAGNTKIIGTGKTAITDTAVGALAGAGIMAASTYSGKVAGDTIKSTAVNAASGMIVGNMMAGAAGSDGVLATTKCKTESGEKDCIIGNIKTIDSNNTLEKWLSNQQGDTCKENTTKVALVNSNEVNMMVCCSDNDYTKLENCKSVTNNVINIQIATNNGSIDLKKVKPSDESIIRYYKPEESNTYKPFAYGVQIGDSPYFYRVTSGQITSGYSKHAYAVFNNLPSKPLGYKKDDWQSLKEKYIPKYYLRNTSDGSVGDEVKISSETEIVFTPLSREASDGGLIDLSNEARVKGTLIGTAAGGALGGFAAYQGATTEIEERWTTAVREYNDSLTNFACRTGERFLSTYNSYIDIPELKKSED